MNWAPGVEHAAALDHHQHSDPQFGCEALQADAITRKCTPAIPRGWKEPALTTKGRVGNEPPRRRRLEAGTVDPSDSDPSGMVCGHEGKALSA
jgi:hypothetical protein